MRINNTAFVVSLLALTLGGCAPVLGPELTLTELPAVEAPVGARVGMGKPVAVEIVQDSRDLAPVDGLSYTTGNVSSLVEGAIKDVLSKNGFSVGGGARLSLATKVTKWQTKVTTTSSTKVESHATIVVELKESGSKVLYTGTYNGSRSATTPVASKNDIRFSLGTAMTEAINQIVEDEKLVKLLVGRS